MEISFRNQEEWHDWLSVNFDKSDGIWIIYYKKGSGRESIKYDEALDEALCYGWIDSKIKRVNDDYYIQWFTPRRKGSKWSARNVEKAENLIASGRMKESGMREFRSADKKNVQPAKNGPVKTPGIPNDLLMQLKMNAVAYENFTRFPDSVRRNFINWLNSSKKEETRKNRIVKLLDLSEKNIKNTML